MKKNDLKNSIEKYINSQKNREFDFSRFSHARLGLGHTGGHLKLNAWLGLQADFAQAKDAVFSTYDIQEIEQDLRNKTIVVHSQAADATQFLLRPDLGRLLAIESEQTSQQWIMAHPEDVNRDLLVVISGGLSPVAIQKQIHGFLPILMQKISEQHWTAAPIIINPKGRVALGDYLNQYFKAKLVIMLIGERPGLSTADSMGIYLTYHAKPGCTDEQRNCISNIHARGLSHESAAAKLITLIQKSMTKGLSGIALKDEDFLSD